MVVTGYPVKKDAGDLGRFFAREIAPVLEEAGAEHDKHLVRSRESSECRERIAPALSGRLRDEPHIARLVPTERFRFPIG